MPSNSYCRGDNLLTARSGYAAMSTEKETVRSNCCHALFPFIRSGFWPIETSVHRYSSSQCMSVSSNLPFVCHTTVTQSTEERHSSVAGRLCACLQTIGSRLASYGDVGGHSSTSADMSLPVSIGPNRCELIYSHDKQPLLELSLRVCLPIKELLHTLSQLAPPANRQTGKQQRPIVKSPPSESKRKDVDTPAKAPPPVRQSQLPQGSSSSNWQPSYHPLLPEPPAALGTLPSNGCSVAR